MKTKDILSLIAIILIIIIVSLWKLYDWHQYLVDQLITHDKKSDVIVPIFHSQSDLTTSTTTSTEDVNTEDTSLVDSTPVISSSTAKVGNFTVIVNCESEAPNIENVSSINIYKDALATQKLETNFSLTGVDACPGLEIQDVNFDGFSDIMVLSNTGNGGGGDNYWLFSTSSQQFYCPSNSPDDCFLANPEFDPTTKTITTHDSFGAGDTQFDTYQFVDGRLKLVNSTTTNP